MSSTLRRPGVGVAAFWALALGPLTAAAAPPCADRPVALTTVWFDVFDQFHDGGAAAASELQRRFCEMRVNIAWRRGEPGGSYAVDGGPEIAVVLLLRHPHHAQVDAPIMGEVPRHATPGQPLVVRVYLDGVSGALGTKGGFSRLEQRLLPRAVGRVATHELVHALSPGVGHARDGLMRSSLGVAALLGDAPTVGERHAHAVQATLRRRSPAAPLLLAAPAPELLIATPGLSR